MRYPCLFVAQEHLTLLRNLAVQFPNMFRELRVLADSDVEVDFFANIAHLQMHRRARALNRLSKVCDNPYTSRSAALSPQLQAEWPPLTHDLRILQAFGRQ